MNPDSVSAQVPDIADGVSIKGAFYPDFRYNVTDITAVIEYASLRGIRVIPEVAMPGHVASMSLAYPFMNSKCYDGKIFKGYGPLNVVSSATYRILKQIFVVVVKTFPDQYLHISCNDIDFDCWLSDPEIKEFMANNKMKSPYELLAVFVATLLEIMSDEKKPIVWQEPADVAIYIPDGIVQVWRGYDSLNYNLNIGYPIILSTCWSVQPDAPDVYWEDFYHCAPEARVENSTFLRQLIGGEALFWAIDIDDSNIMSKLWPATSAVAERLWSHGLAIEEELPRSRIEEHVCRMLRRGIHARPPNGPGNCFYRTHQQRSNDTRLFSQQKLQPKKDRLDKKPTQKIKNKRKQNKFDHL